MEANTHRLHKTVRASFAHVALVGWWDPHAVEGSGLGRVPAGTVSSWEAGGAIGPQRLPCARGLIHQHHGGVNELPPAARGVDNSRKRSGAGCPRVCPGSGRHGGNAAGPGVQTVLVLPQESEHGTG